MAARGRSSAACAAVTLVALVLSICCAGAQEDSPLPPPPPDLYEDYYAYEDAPLVSNAFQDSFTQAVTDEGPSPEVTVTSGDPLGGGEAAQEGELAASPLLPRYIVRTRSRGPPSLGGQSNMAVEDLGGAGLYLLTPSNAGGDANAGGRAALLQAMGASTISGMVGATRSSFVPGFIANDPQYEFAEPDVMVSVAAIPTECGGASAAGDNPCPDSVWNMNAIKAPAVWRARSAIGSRRFPVGVVDSGVLFTHADLTANTNRSVSSVACSACNGTTDAVGTDNFGHGSHVAGIIAGGHSAGTMQTVGINAVANIVSCKFINANGGGALADAITCINRLANMPTPVIIQNHSWSYRGDRVWGALKTAVLESICKKGGLFIAAAGNNGAQITTGHWPANLVNDPDVGGCVLPVAAVKPINDVRSNVGSLQLCDFSNWGDSVRIAAPGWSITSSWVGASNAVVKRMNGTSMAAPHVAGAAILVKNLYPRLTGAEIKTILVTTATAVPAPINGKSIGGGVLNVQAAVAAAAARFAPPPPPCVAAGIAVTDCAACCTRACAAGFSWSRRCS